MKQYVVDAFTDRVFHGNPAAVRIVDEFPDDATMQAIATENALSETAFARKGSAGQGAADYQLRWFTPGGEIDLCGHATLATAFVLFSDAEHEAEELSFDTLGGRLAVRRKGDFLEMAFPAYELEPVEVTDAMAYAFGSRPQKAYLGRDLVCVFKYAETVRSMKPDMAGLAKLDGLLQHTTAPGDVSGTDCVSRSFAPKLAVEEDPVCGSGHCHIAPYWAQRFGTDKIVAYQASKRGGTLYCKVDGDEVRIAGKAVLYSAAETTI